MYYFSCKKKEQGFTLIEIIVVISIITILFSIIMAAVLEARKSSRDKKRVADLAEIELALRLYTEDSNTANRGKINCPGGLKIDGRTNVVSLPSGGTCPDGTAILSFINTRFKAVPADPLGPNNTDYYYYLDTQHDCNPNPDQAIIFASNLERGSSNAGAICPPASADNQGGYHSTSKGLSSPFVKAISFIEP